MKCFAREKLAEKDISWHQAYTDKSAYLKNMFEEIIGEGSYFRFEGRDAGSGYEYYCILGPAKLKHPRAKYFAGVRKLPATFSAWGKYFDSMDSAARYANEMWGVPTPSELVPYTSSVLHDISKKIDRWKKEKEREENE